MNSDESAIARSLLGAGAVTLRPDPPFRWASGRLAPIYCDNRLLMSFPDRRQEVTRAFAARLEELDWRPQVIAGTATAGIPHAAWLAGQLDLPLVYVRGATKGHGKENRVEGRLDPGQQVVLIEDLISTGGSSIAAAQVLIEAQARLLGVAAIFTYGLTVAAQRFESAQIAWSALTNFDVLAREAVTSGSLTPADQEVLSAWQKDPKDWSLTRGGAG